MISPFCIGNSHFNDKNFEGEYSSVHQRSVMEKNSKMNFRERQRVSTESSRASCSSSSRSSSFSSLDCNRTTQLEPSSCDRILFPETPSRDPSMSPQTSSSQFVRQTLDLRDVVKDSMYREVQGLSVNAKTMKEAADPVLKYRDSPRPLQTISNDSHGSGLNTKKNSPADLKESLRVLSKLREAPWNHNEPRELLRVSSYNVKDGSSFSVSKDAPRFSYDGREMNHVHFESQDISKSTIKLKDLPRLSLDSREGSIRNMSADAKSNFSAKSWQKNGGEFDGKVQNSQQKSKNQARLPSVVAKLMGLETLPEAGSASNTNSGSSRIYPGEDFAYSSRSSENLDLCKPIRLSSMNLRNEPTSPRWRNPDTGMKPISRFPIEPAPWKRIDGKRASQKPASTSTRGPGKVPNTFPSIYSEVEKRLKDLEFTESGKDLRALKQILEAMQVKGLLETQDVGQDSSLTDHKDHEQKYTSSTYDARSASSPKPQFDKFLASTKNDKSLKSYESPIVIMKPAKLVKKSDIPSSDISLDSLSGLPKYRESEFVDDRKGLTCGRIAEDKISKTSPQDSALNAVNLKTDSRVLRTTQTSTRSHQLSKDSSAGSGKSSGSYSPRIQQKNLDQEKRSRPPTPPHLSKLIRQSIKQSGESNSPGGRRRPKHPNLQQKDDQLGEVSSESRNLSYPENEISVHSNESTILHSKNLKANSPERSPGSHSASMKVAEFLVSGIVEKKSPHTLSEDESGEFAHVPPEYPSPVSVLDNALYAEDSTSPIKLVGKTLKVDGSMDSDRISNTVQGSSVDVTVPNSMESGSTSEICRRKLQNVENLVQKLRRLNSSHDEARIDYIASLCENTKPEHRYISEILLASGLILRDLSSSLATFQFHPSGHPINPELFLVLEQTKASTLRKEECSSIKTTELMTKEKIHRKLVFDVTNEILAGKLAFAGKLKPHKVARKDLNAQKLLRELCSEIDELQDKNSRCVFNDDDDELKNILFHNMMRQSESWINFNNDISGIVLDVERSIFKDLVDEIVGKAGGSRTKKARRRQLFSK
ncbi:protein LONGIFOLIA 2 isoform X2 [Olea europaea var. sylvestris]|uniref:protein LONGIFOLIA 2 isoform X2 n=1 Tax=Olea europaea var. sylvestris TaxID=158386 RepID=UPI000C1D0078|nr:protein LONGIFOLIA 2 isoform X2 [Olea europaea var. sylvestris]